ncbi:hypothetical protein PENSPDRAFT_750314 [Peniophora sp. CONT]|nr:hypothetical protein PENSPDRAFT_750314 [Peniophora sp. CONT]
MPVVIYVLHLHRVHCCDLNFVLQSLSLSTCSDVWATMQSMPLRPYGRQRYHLPCRERTDPSPSPSPPPRLAMFRDSAFSWIPGATSSTRRRLRQVNQLDRCTFTAPTLFMCAPTSAHAQARRRKKHTLAKPMLLPPPFSGNLRITRFQFVLESPPMPADVNP